MAEETAVAEPEAEVEDTTDAELFDGVEPEEVEEEVVDDSEESAESEEVSDEDEEPSDDIKQNLQKALSESRHINRELNETVKALAEQNKSLVEGRTSKGDVKEKTLEEIEAENQDFLENPVALTKKVAKTEAEALRAEYDLKLRQKELKFQQEIAKVVNPDYDEVVTPDFIEQLKDPKNARVKQHIMTAENPAQEAYDFIKSLDKQDEPDAAAVAKAAENERLTVLKNLGVDPEEYLKTHGGKKTKKKTKPAKSLNDIAGKSADDAKEKLPSIEDEDMFTAGDL